jgi:hypothetical protein
VPRFKHPNPEEHMDVLAFAMTAQKAAKVVRICTRHIFPCEAEFDLRMGFPAADACKVA